MPEDSFLGRRRGEDRPHREQPTPDLKSPAVGGGETLPQRARWW